MALCLASFAFAHPLWTLPPVVNLSHRDAQVAGADRREDSKEAGEGKATAEV